jgi:hypothetical protein
MIFVLELVDCSGDRPVVRERSEGGIERRWT